MIHLQRVHLWVVRTFLGFQRKIDLGVTMSLFESADTFRGCLVMYCGDIDLVVVGRITERHRMMYAWQDNGGSCRL